MSDMFYRSAEIRWYLYGATQLDDMLYWFMRQDQLGLNEQGQYDTSTTTGPFVRLEKQRNDDYLLLPDCATVSVKQREGKLEVKALVAGPRPFTMDAIVGRVDQWVKWSFDPSDEIAKLLEGELDQSGPWCRIGKKRYLQKYSFDSGCLVAVSPDQRPDTGCNIELTVLAVDDSVGAWLTFGFEAFGPSGRVMAFLDGAVKHFLTVHGPPPVSLDGRDSLSYPAWLAMLR
jgi:hypothetical protein